MVKNVATIYLVRHGESVANRDHIVSGHLDTELSEAGKTQALETRKKLSHIHFDTVYSSDLKRAVQTAELILERKLTKSEQLFDLRERSFANIEGRPSTQLKKIFDEQQDHYNSLSDKERWEYEYIPGMDSNYSLSTRFMAALEKIAKTNMGKTVLISTHGGCIRTALMALGYATELQLPLGSFGNAGYIELQYDGKKFSVVKVVGLKKQLQPNN